MLQTGSALLTVPAANAAGDFAVEFDTYFGGGSGSGGEGLSFSFGALPPTHFGEHAALIEIELAAVGLVDKCEAEAIFKTPCRERRHSLTGAHADSLTEVDARSRSIESKRSDELVKRARVGHEPAVVTVKQGARKTRRWLK